MGEEAFFRSCFLLVKTITPYTGIEVVDLNGISQGNGLEGITRCIHTGFLDYGTFVYGLLYRTYYEVVTLPLYGPLRVRSIASLDSLSALIVNRLPA